MSAVTGPAGEYRIDGVLPGPAALSSRLVNFSTARRQVAVRAGETLDVDITLTLSLTAGVVVTGMLTFRNVADLENPRESLVGIAASASVGAITAAQLMARPIATTRRGCPANRSTAWTTSTRIRPFPGRRASAFSSPSSVASRSPPAIFRITSGTARTFRR